MLRLNRHGTAAKWTVEPTCIHWVTLYFMLAGRPPFGTGTLAQRLQSIRLPTRVSSKYPQGLPSSDRTIVPRMMAKKPGDRYQRMREVVAICDAILPKLSGTKGELQALANTGITQEPNQRFAPEQPGGFQ